MRQQQTTQRALTLRQVTRLAFGPSTPLKTRLHALALLHGGIKQSYIVNLAPVAAQQ